MTKYKLKEFITQIRGVTYKPSDLSDSNNGIPILRANNIKDDNIVYDDLVYINPKIIKSDQLLKDGDVVICGSSGSKNIVGKAATFKGNNYNISFGSFCRVVRIKDNPNIIPNFIRLFFSSEIYRKQISDSSIGANIKNIKSKDIDNLTINIPSLSVQNDAVNKLTGIIITISSKITQLKLLDELVKSRFVEMFETIDLSNKKDDWCLINSVAEIYTGTTPSTLDESNWNGNILWVTPAELMSESFYIYDTNRKITEKGRSSKSLSIMPKDTILLSTRAPIGKVAIVGKEMTCNQGFKNIYCDKSKMNNIFLFTILKNNTKYLNELGNGATFKEISKKTVENIFVPVPPIELQNQFADFFTQVEKLKSSVKESIEKLETLKKSLMQEYFS